LLPTSPQSARGWASAKNGCQFGNGNPDRNVYFVPLVAGVQAVVDASDFPLISQYVWSLDPQRRYAVAYLDPRDWTKCVRMHRLIMDARAGEVVDHINGDGLDNRRSNLRVCLQAENSRNRRKGEGFSSRFKGVSLVKGRREKPWRAQIRHGEKVRCLGYFSLEEEASRAYDEAAIALFGAFARVNAHKPAIGRAARRVDTGSIGT
jgi:HNH endonuclease